MEDGGPSQTARRVAAHRLDFTRVPADYGDPAADQALAVDVAAGRQAPASRMHDYLAARTAFFDRAVTGALGRGVAQVVVGAAGYDGRAFRYAKPGVRWFEVDHPATQRDKLERLERLAIDASHVRFVEADFTRDPVASGCARPGSTRTYPACSCSKGWPSTWSLPSWRTSSGSSGRSPRPTAAWLSACPCPGRAATEPAPASRLRWPGWGSRPGPRSRPPRPKRCSPGPAGSSRPRPAATGRAPTAAATASAWPACSWPAPGRPHPRGPSPGRARRRAARHRAAHAEPATRARSVPATPRAR